MPLPLPTYLSAADRICLELLHQHGVGSHELEKMISNSLNQADVNTAAYGHKAKRIPAQLAHTFLNGAFFGTFAHLNEGNQRALQQPVDNEGYEDGQTPRYIIVHDYLGESSGILSLSRSIMSSYKSLSLFLSLLSLSLPLPVSLPSPAAFVSAVHVSLLLSSTSQ